jgi:DNA-binding LacI/PurR family transcriptional regulator
MVTIADVARVAGVSVSTVSYVLSGKRPISEDTRERVESSVRALGYRPNAGARALASKRTNIIALIVPFRSDNNIPVLMQFVSAVAIEARSRNYDVLLLTDDEGVEGVRRVGASSLVDAVVLLDVQLDDPRLPVLRDVGLPFVVIGQPGVPETAVLDLDLLQAADLCVQHLVDLGHRHVVFLGSAPSVYERRAAYAVLFEQGFEAAARRAGIAWSWQPLEDPGYESVASRLEGLLAQHPETTAFVVHNESALPSVLTALQSLGRRVPEDVSVVAYCPDDIAVRLPVGVTNVAPPSERIGREAVAMALALADGHDITHARLLVPELTVRSSTAVPARR